MALCNRQEKMWNKCSHVRPSSRERLGSCPWALWVRMLQSERRSLRQEAISAWSLCVRRAPAGCRAEDAWLLLLCSGSLICSCRVRFCSISSWFWADSCNTSSQHPSKLIRSDSHRRTLWWLKSDSPLSWLCAAPTHSALWPTPLLWEPESCSLPEKSAPPKPANKQLMTHKCSNCKQSSNYVNIKYKHSVSTWIWEPSCSIIRCCFSMTCQKKNWALKQLLPMWNSSMRIYKHYCATFAATFNPHSSKSVLSGLQSITVLCWAGK